MLQSKKKGGSMNYAISDFALDLDLLKMEEDHRKPKLVVNNTKPKVLPTLSNKSIAMYQRWERQNRNHRRRLGRY